MTCTPPVDESGDKAPRLSFVACAEVASHAHWRHDSEYPMIVHYLCTLCNHESGDRGDVAKHLQDNHDLLPLKSHSTALVRLCMYPGCELAHHLFFDDDELSVHIMSTHKVRLQYIFLFKTCIRHINVKSHGVSIGAQHLNNIRERHLNILKLFTISFGKVHRRYKGRKSTTPPPLLTEGFDEMEANLQTIRNTFITQRETLSNAEARSHLFFQISISTRDTWTTDEANYCFVCTVHACTHESLFETKEDWLLHMREDHTQHVRYLASPYELKDTHLFLAPVAKIAMQAYRFDWSTASVAILHAHHNLVIKERRNLETRLRTELGHPSGNFKSYFDNYIRVRDFLNEGRGWTNWRAQLHTQRILYLALRCIQNGGKFSETEFFQAYERLMQHRQRNA